MAAVSENFDVKIRVIFPFLTKSLSTDDSSSINATGNFNFNPPPQVDTATAQSRINVTKELSSSERKANLKGKLESLLGEYDSILDAMRKRAKHLALIYDPELTENESLANAEEELFGVASGRITYEMFEQVLCYQEKINKYISHSSIENGGSFGSAVA